MRVGVSLAGRELCPCDLCSNLQVEKEHSLSLSFSLSKASKLHKLYKEAVNYNALNL